MNNGASSQAPQGSQAHPLQGLIKPEQVSKLPNLSDGQKISYTQGVTKLWETLQNNKQDSAEYQQALKKLNEVSGQIKASVRKWHQEQQSQGPQGAQQNGGPRPTSQGPHGQAGGPGHPMPQVQQGRSQASTNEQFSAKVLQAVQNLQIIVPPQFHAQGPDKAQIYLREARTKYAQSLQKIEIATSKLQDLQNHAEQRQNQGKNFTTDEAQNFNQMRAKYQQQSHEGREFLGKFRNQQDTLRAQQIQNSGNINGLQGLPMTADSVAHNAQQTPGGAATQTSQQQMGSDSQNQPQNVNPALEATRNQASIGARPSISPSNNVQPPIRQLPPTQAQIPPSGNPGQQPVPHPPPHINTSVGPTQQTQSPQSMQPNSAPLGPPHPLTHQDAVAHAARTYSQPNLQQTTPQSLTHAHPQMGGRDVQNNNVKMPIPKNLNVTQPQQVPMGPARPTLSGGPSTGAMAPMGQPAIQKHPAYVLEGEGERVLSKKKLEELVRQVTGGGESEEGEGLTAEAEEVSLP